MYAEYYGLSGKPFQLTPDPRFYFDSSTHHKAMAYLKYGLNQGEGFIIITGEIGAGKTTLVGRLIEDLDDKKFIVGKIVTTMLGADTVLRMVASAFGIEIEGRDKALLLKDIESFLRQCHKLGRKAVLLIDEAQNLPTAALEELRMLSNFQEGDHALLQSFLVGQPEFRKKWAFDPNLEQLRQRVIATHHLQSMTFDETKEYIIHRLTLVGWQKGRPDFTEGAFDLIYENTGGVPRKLNTLCSRLMLYGAIEEVNEITGDVVTEVVSDMEYDAPTDDGSFKEEKSLSETSVNGSAHYSALSRNDLEERVAKLEKFVKLHDETIKNALDLASVWLNGADPDVKK